MAISFVASAQASSSPNTAPNLQLPACNVGDLIIIATAVGDTANNGMPAPLASGTTAYTRVPGVAATLYGNGSAADVNLDLWYKIAAASDSGDAPTLTATGGTNASNIAMAMVFRGVDTTTPFDTNANTATGTSTATGANPPSHNHSGAAGTWTVGVWAVGHTGGATASGTFPTGYTTNAAQLAHNDTIDAWLGMGYNSSPADPEDPGAITPSPIGTASADGWAAITVSLKEGALPAITGTGALAAQSADITGSGTSSSTGTGALAAQAATIDGTGTSGSTGTGALAAQAADITGAGDVADGPSEVTGTGALTAQSATIAGTGASGSTGTGALAAQAADITGAGTSGSTGTGSLAAQSADITGAGTSGSTGSGALTAQAAAIDGTGTVADEEPITGTGALVAGAATMAGSGTITGAAQTPGNSELLAPLGDLSDREFQAMAKMHELQDDLDDLAQFVEAVEAEGNSYVDPRASDFDGDPFSDDL